MAGSQDPKAKLNCRVCGGDIEERLITHVAEYKGRVVIIRNVPAEVCTQCGERLFTPETVDKIQKIVWEAPAPTRTREVAEYDLAEVA